MNKEFKVGQRVWRETFKDFATVIDDSYELISRIKFDDGEEYSVFNIDLHQTADDMFEELGFKKTSGGEKSTVYSHGIHALIFDDKFHFEKRGYIYHGSVTPQLHLAIQQKLIELGWIE